MKSDCQYFEYGVYAPKAYGAFCVCGPIVCMTKDLCKNCKRFERSEDRIESKSNISSQS